MGLSIEDKNDKEAWAAYTKEGEKLIKEVLQKQAEIDKKYEEINAKRVHGLDGDPSSKEHKELTHWFGQKVKRLQEKYGIMT